jgi:DNA (cytosine-5)-methyltransferase 1
MNDTKKGLRDMVNRLTVEEQMTMFDLFREPLSNREHIYPSPKWDSFNFIDLFAGIGGIRLGFENVGGKCVFSSEWDKDAQQTYYANFGECPAGDITKIDADDMPDFDILLGGFPCQPFSIIGDKAGFNHETQGTLFFDIERILAAKQPTAFMLENVRNLTAHDGGRTFKVILSHLQSLGYHVYAEVLNALNYGVPQKRERIIICGFRDNVDFEFPHPIPKNERLTLSDILEPEEQLDRNLWVRDCIRESRFARMKTIPEQPYITHENVGGSITPHHFSCALRAGASANYILVNNERRPSAREMLRLQGFPDDFKVVVPYTAIKKQTGNSVAVPVIKAVATQMLKALKAYERSSTYADIKQRTGEESTRYRYPQVESTPLQANTNS